MGASPLQRALGIAWAEHRLDGFGLPSTRAAAALGAKGTNTPQSPLGQASKKTGLEALLARVVAATAPAATPRLDVVRNDLVALVGAAAIEAVGGCDWVNRLKTSIGIGLSCAGAHAHRGRSGTILDHKALPFALTRARARL
eukprot:scaffold84373_cov36-Prasinocladus_malaysianus.AAC.1